MKKFFQPTLVALCLFASGVSFANNTEHNAHPHWSYTGETGPAKWNTLDENFGTCQLGHEQSPIDIKAATVAQGKAIEFEYHPEKMSIINNGHTIQVNTDKQSQVELASGEYKLLQFHFHTPSEEAVDGSRYDMVAHLVHANDKNELAVVAVLFKVGAENSALKPLFQHLPQHEGETVTLDKPFDVSTLLPKDHTYYEYMGSLTTPPCSEGVHWQVLKEPVQLSAAQLKAFSKLYPMNARPLQETNGREIKEIHSN